MPTYPLHADTALYTTGATLYHVTLGDLVWLGEVGDRDPRQPPGEDGGTRLGRRGQISTRAIDSGFVEIVVAAKNRTRMIGLSRRERQQRATPTSTTRIYMSERRCASTSTRTTPDSGPSAPTRPGTGSGSACSRASSPTSGTTSSSTRAHRADVAAAAGRRHGSPGGRRSTGSPIVGAAAVDALDPPAIAPGHRRPTRPHRTSTMSALPGATVRYTTNGSEPDGASTVYSGRRQREHLHAAEGARLQARLQRERDGQRDVHVQLRHPGGADADTRADVRHIRQRDHERRRRRDDPLHDQRQRPDGRVGSPYLGPVTVDATTTIRARAFKTDWTTSATTAVTYPVKVATPVLGLASGPHAAGAPITVTLPTPGATGNLTTNGVDPTDPATNEVAIASGGTVFAGSYTLKVRAYKAGLTASDVATATYTVTGSVGPGAVSSGAEHSLAAVSDGQVWGWGASASGEAGTGASVAHRAPAGDRERPHRNRPGGPGARPSASRSARTAGSTPSAREPSESWGWERRARG